MASSAASTVEQYLASLAPDRRAAIASVRDVVNARLPAGYEETMQHGMISWIVPTSRLAKTYNGYPLMLAGLASQKQYMALYLMTVYGDHGLNAWFRDAYRAAGKQLDMGKSCVRFKTLDELPLGVIGDVIARVPVDTYVARYEESRSRTVTPRPIGKADSSKKPAAPATSSGKQAAGAAKLSGKPAASRAAKVSAKLAASGRGVAKAKPRSTAKARSTRR